MPRTFPFPIESRSCKAETKTSLSFENCTEETVEIYWIDYEGQAHCYRKLAPNDSWQVSTWVTHVWAVLGSVSGQFLARGIAHEIPHKVIISRYERTTVKRSNEKLGFQIQPLYVLPADGEDHKLDVNGTLATSISAWNLWFAEQTGGTQLRIDNFRERPDVVFVRLTSTAAEVRANTTLIDEELRTLGFDEPNKIRAIYYDGPNRICGDGSMTQGIASVYLQGDLCPGNQFTSDVKRPGYWEFVMLHEVLHALGCVPPAAPNVSKERPAHVDDHPHDIMYYRSAKHPLVLDAGRDDYYAHGQKDWFDLARSPFLEPRPVSIDWPIPWQLHLIRKELADSPPDFGVATAPARDEMTLTIDNQSGRDLFLFFLNEKAKAVYYGYLPPSTTRQQQTYEGHGWLLVTVDGTQNIEIIQQFVANAKCPDIFIPKSFGQSSTRLGGLKRGRT